MPYDPADLAKAVEKVTESLLRGYRFKILQFQEYNLSNTTLKDILLTYEIPQDKIYWSRITGFKVQDETRKIFGGE
jgi:ABC-type metal ion transport system substrate-binding protein